MAAASIAPQPTGFDAAVLPAGFDSALPQVSMPVVKPGTSFYADFGPVSKQWSLQVGNDEPYARAWTGSHPVDIARTTCWVSNQHKDLTVSWLLPDGARARIVGPISEDDAIAAARSVSKVGPDDPRLQAR